MNNHKGLRVEIEETLSRHHWKNILILLTLCSIKMIKRYSYKYRRRWWTTKILQCLHHHLNHPVQIWRLLASPWVSKDSIGKTRLRITIKCCLSRFAKSLHEQVTYRDYFLLFLMKASLFKRLILNLNQLKPEKWRGQSFSLGPSTKKSQQSEVWSRLNSQTRMEIWIFQSLWQVP